MKKYKYCPICKSLLTHIIENDTKRLSCCHCDWVYYANPLPSVAAIVRNDKSEILLIKRGVSPGKGKWSLPTGFVELNEHPEKAVIRELEEETNIMGTVKRLVGVYTEKTKVYGNILLIGYEIDSYPGIPKPGSDTTQAKFFPIDRLPNIPFVSHKALIKNSTVIIKNKTTFIEILKSKITEARITHTQLFYKGSMGIDGKIMQAAGIIPGEKVHVLNYNNGERLITYTIEEKSNSGKIILYGPAAWKGKVGDKLCILSYAQVYFEDARHTKAKIVILDERNRVKRKLT